MSATRLRRVLGVLTILAALAAVTVPASALAQSAFPLKQSADSGILDYFSSVPTRGCDGGGTCVNGWDACTYSDLEGNFSSNIQQYTVPGCTPVETRGISVGGAQTSGWAVYCPASAPYSWVNGYPGSQGQTFQWYADSNYVGSFSEPPGENTGGPNPPGKIDFSVHDWSFYGHHWLFIAGCSTIANDDPAAGHQPPYSHGIGPSARRGNVPGVSGSGLVDAKPVRSLRGPARRVTRPRRHHYDISRSR